jgi:hypothetical protein
LPKVFAAPLVRATVSFGHFSDGWFGRLSISS